MRVCGSRSGMAPMVLVTIVLAIGLLLGISHFGSARNLRLSGIAQAEYLEARALAQAGLAKALVVLKREHQAGCYLWRFPDQSKGRYVLHHEFSDTIDGGRFQVESVEPLVLDDGLRSIGPFKNRPYRVRRKVIGAYDVYRIVASGTARGGRQRVRLVAIAKMIRTTGGRHASG